MSKGLVGSFVGLTAAILTDYSVYNPTAIKGLERDKKRLMSLASNLGLSLFTIVLPDLGAVLDRALDQERLFQTHLPLTRRSKAGTVIPRLFQGIWSRIFDDSGCLKQNVDPNDILFLRTICYVGKKYRLRCADEKLFRATKEYFDVDGNLPPASPIWDSDGAWPDNVCLGSLVDCRASFFDQGVVSVNGTTASFELLSLAQQTADRAALIVGDFVPSDFGFKHGPGATSEYPRGGSYKYQFPSWSPRLQRIFPWDVFGSSKPALLERGWSVDRVPPESETHSRLIAVPKTQKTPRLIAAEPTAHQWCQQNVRAFLNERIRLSFLGNSIDFSNQSLSGSAALAASISGTHATLDLKEASDRLSCWLVQRIFRKNRPLLEALVVTRTRYLHNSIDKKLPSLLKLRKFASMGSSLTFPVQSIVFTILCIAAGLHYNQLKCTDVNIKRLSRQVRVYGDDLIVPVTWVPFVQALLAELFLKVNDRKSFWNGKFREACGTDAFDGTVVSPTYVHEMYSQSKPSSLISVVDTANNLFERGFWHASNYMIQSIPRSVLKYVPLVTVGSGSFGLYTYGGKRATAKNRWSTKYHRWEHLTYRLISRRDDAQRHEGTENLLQYFTEARPYSQLSYLDDTAVRTGLFSVAEPMLGLGWSAI